MKSQFQVSRRRQAVALLGLFGGAATAHAGTSCVSSLADLKTALDLAKDQATTIQVVQGTYDLKTTSWGGNFAQLHDGSSVMGGYTGANCSGRNIDVNNTTFTDTDTTAAHVQVLGDATVEGITFKLPYGLNVDSGSAGGGELLFRRDVFTGTKNAVDGALYIQWGPAPNAVIRVVDSLVYGNTSTKADSAAIRIIEEDGSPKVEFVNDTIMDNVGQMDGVYVEEYDSTQVYAYNNIFYGNAGTDFKVTGSAKTVLVDNVIGHYSYPVPDTDPIGTTHADPQLDANYKPIEAPPSNVINSGTDDNVIGGLPTTDLPGHAREIGSEPDRGAYESSINDATILSVTNTNDSGPGSLRAAILSSNATATGTIIYFAIGSSCGPQKITLQTALPVITHETHIEGFTQAGASANTLDSGDNATLCVILDGDTHGIATGLDIATGTLGGAVSVKGLAFSGFKVSAILVSSGFGHLITGNQTGGKVGNQLLMPNADGIVLGQTVSNVTIGGDNAADRNQFGDVTNSAIQIDAASQFLGAAASNNQVVNNYVGVVYSGGVEYKSGTYATGIYIGGPKNDVEKNLIGSASRGVWIETADANNNTVTRNTFGTDIAGAKLSNARGIYIDTGASNNTLTSNSIAYSTAAGVTIVDDSIHNDLRGTTFSGNAGLPIDLGSDGVSANDNDSTQVGQPNRKQNYPVLTAALGTQFEGHIQGSLTSTPGTYTIQLFASTVCSPSGHGDGEYEASSSKVTINSGGLVDGQGTAQFDVDAVAPFGIGFGVITATATDASGDTSEFSACFNYTNDTIFTNGFDPFIIL